MVLPNCLVMVLVGVDAPAPGHLGDVDGLGDDEGGGGGRGGGGGGLGSAPGGVVAAWVTLIGELINCDIIVFYNAPQKYSNILKGLRIWSPVAGVIVFCKAMVAQFPLLIQMLFSPHTSLK